MTGIQAEVPPELADEVPNSTVESPRWIVSSDYSLDDLFSYSGCPGVEITSPPLSVNDALDAAEEVAEFIELNGATNELCGFHWNVSIPEIGKLDPFALAMVVPEARLAMPFRRFRPIDRITRYQLLLRLAMDERTDPLDLSFARPDYLLNLKKLKFGYVEFRHAGGDWLRKIEEVKIALVICLSAMFKAVRATPTMLSEWKEELRHQAALVRRESSNWRNVEAGPLEKDGFLFGSLKFAQCQDAAIITPAALSTDICHIGNELAWEEGMFALEPSHLPYRLALAYLIEAGIITFL